MHNRDSIFDLALPFGTWFGIRVRVSPLFLLVGVAVGVQQWNAQLAVLLTLSLLAAVVLHELTHAISVRLTGGVARELLLWPLGGLLRLSATSSTVPSSTAMVGSIANLAVSAVCLPALLQTPESWTILNPLKLPQIDLEAGVGTSLLIICFYANWIVFIANLVPSLPMDCGRAIDSLFVNRLGRSLGQQALLRTGISIGLLLVFAALLIENVWVCAFGAGLVAYNLRESLRQHISETFDESFMGYDFSQGYTSLERSVPAEAEVNSSVLQRWLARRRVQREERQKAKAEEAERELDFLLAKVHTYGINSLTDSERRTLKRASARYRGRSKS